MPFRVAIQAIFAIAAFVFWAFGYPHALAWQEQFQLFLTTSDYFFDRIIIPGGLACYIGEFLTQFYNNPYIGSAVLALLLLTIEILTERLLTHSNTSFLLSFLPSLMMILLLGDENILPAFVISFIFALSICGIRSTILRFVAIPLFYYLAGPIVIFSAIIFAIDEKKKSIALAEILTAIACIFLSSLFLPFYEIRVWSGIFYHRIVPEFHYNILIFSSLALIIIIISKYVDIKKDITTKITFFSVIAMFFLTFLLKNIFFDAKKYEMIDYDFLVRTNQWNAIISKAEKKNPDTPMGVCALNLALGMNGELMNRAFDFFQRSPQGLVATFDRDFATTLLTSEIYFQLGLINTSQRLSFEAMEAIPDYRKSSRVMKRLAETNLINGQYEVAKKYLNLLKETIFYKKWAKNRLSMIENSIKIDSHPLYGRMRRERLQEDFLFSEGEIDKICGQLYMHDRDNELAKQYLLLYPLLNCDLPTFVQYYTVVSSCGQMPKSKICQEAIALHFWQQKQKPPKGLVDEFTLGQLQDFMQIYQAYHRRVPQLEKYKSTLWYYFLED